MRQAHPVVRLVGVGVREAAEDDGEVVALFHWSGALRDVARESAQDVLIERLVEAGVRLAWVGADVRGSSQVHCESGERRRTVRTVRDPSVAAGVVG